MRPTTQDDCPSVSVSRLRALGEVTEDMSRVRVTIAGVSREVGLWHMRFPNSGGWSFFLCPSCGRRARILRLYEKIACRRCTRPGPSSPPLPWRIDLVDRSQQIERLRERLSGAPAWIRSRATAALPPTSRRVAIYCATC